MIVAVAIDGGAAGCTDADAAMAALHIVTSIVYVFRCANVNVAMAVVHF
jgi:hypothetical protein